MSLFYLVEKHDGVGLAAHLFCELSAFLISHVSRRRTHEARGVETLGVFAHVYTYQGILRTEHLLGKFLCKICLAHTCRTEEHERADRVVGLFQSNAVALYCLHHLLYGLVLCHNACLQLICHAAQPSAFALCHTLHGHS